MSAIKQFLKNIYYKIPSSAVLMFHHVTDEPEIKSSGCTLSKELFYKIIESFTDYASLTDVLKKPSQKRIAITFDDGLEDLYTVAYPFLKARNIPFTAFIATDLLDKPGYITTEQLRILSEDPLVCIGSHGVSHNLLTSLNYEGQLYEFQKSREILEGITHKPVKIFAYSHGKYNKDSLKLAKLYDYCIGVGGHPINRVAGYNKRNIGRYNMVSDSVETNISQIKKFTARGKTV